MSMARFIILFMLVGGIFVPLTFQILRLVLESYPAIDFELGYYLMYLVIILWPSSLMLMPFSGEESNFLLILLIPIAVNMALYFSIGTAIWYGFFMKKYWVLFMLAITMGYIWWNLLTL